MTKLRGAGFLLLLAACSAPSGEEVGASTAAATDGERHVYVSMADQMARAFEGTRCVREFPISTGKVYAGGNFDTTLHGDRRYYDFPILSKAKVVRMRSPFANVSYDQDVYNAVKLTDWGIYLHEANWTRTGPAESQVTGGDCGHCGDTTYAPYGFSHGCINERHEDAEWLYDWVPSSTTKKVVHLTHDAFGPETCDHVSTTTATTTTATSDPNQVSGITYQDCLAHPTHCLEDLPGGGFVCWRSGARSSTGRKTCESGTWK